MPLTLSNLRQINLLKQLTLSNYCESVHWVLPLDSILYEKLLLSILIPNSFSYFQIHDLGAIMFKPAKMNTLYATTIKHIHFPVHTERTNTLWG